MQAYAAVKFADACLRGLRGDAGIIQCAFVSSQVCHQGHPSTSSLELINSQFLMTRF